MEKSGIVVVHGYIYLYDKGNDLRIMILEPERYLGSIRISSCFKLVSWNNVDPKKVFFGWNSKFEECYRNVTNCNSNIYMVVEDNISETLFNELISVNGDLIELSDGTYKIEI